MTPVHSILYIIAIPTEKVKSGYDENSIKTLERVYKHYYFIIRVMSNLPALFGMYMTQMQVFPLSAPMGAYQAAQGGMAYGQAFPNGAGNRNAVTNGVNLSCVSEPADAAAQGGEATAERSTEPLDNELIDFDAF